MIASLQESGSEIQDIDRILEFASEWRQRLASETGASTAIGELIASVHLTGKGVRIALKVPIPSSSEEQPSTRALRVSHFVPMKLKRRGVEMRIVIDGQVQAPQQVDPALLKALARARCWFEEVASGRAQSLVEIARYERLPKRYVTRRAKLAFVSPMVAEAVAGGSAPAGINLQMLMDGRLAPPLDWKDQQLMLQWPHVRRLAIQWRNLGGTGEGAWVTSPQRELRRIDTNRAHRIALRCPHDCGKRVHGRISRGSPENTVDRRLLGGERGI